MKDFLKDTKASLSVAKIIGLVIGIYVMASILPSAITQITNSSTAGWGTAEIALWGLLPLIFIVVIIMWVLPKWK